LGCGVYPTLDYRGFKKKCKTKVRMGKIPIDNISSKRYKIENIL
jgi:hypothetical protein